MHYDIAAVHQHPFAGPFAFGADDEKTGFLDLGNDVIGQCLGLARGVRAGDGDVVEYRGDFRYVDELNVARLDVFERIYYDCR